jgi:1-acyl-sn-glycerol-3-phosphate acyltransferase
MPYKIVTLCKIRMMKKILSKIIFWLMGWEVIGTSDYPKKCIVVAAPHTSNWDFLIGRCYGYIVGITPKYLIKSELFFPVLGTLFKWNGGIPVYRKSQHNIVDQIITRFSNTNELILGIAPEGTRKRVEKWKTGFYHIAHNSNIPILLMAMDYENKKVGIIDSITPTADIEKDLLFIQEKYKDIKGCIPENYNPIIR